MTNPGGPSLCHAPFFFKENQHVRVFAYLPKAIIWLVGLRHCAQWSVFVLAQVNDVRKWANKPLAQSH